jgi:uncharacterized protein with NRDE domain
MCLLALFYRVVEDAPIVVGANREEFYARGGEPPQVLDGPLRSIGGRDPVAGGTWLGVNERGVLIALTNRRKSQPVSSPRSRGLLVRQLLGCPSAAEAIELASRELQQHPYEGCNVVCVDAERAAVLHAADWLRVRLLPPGLHVLANQDLNDPSDARVAHVLGWLGQWSYPDSAACIEALRQVCAQHAPEFPPICHREALRGTVSSSLIVLPTGSDRTPIDLAHASYLHAQGPPDSTPYQDVSHLLRGLAVGGP